MPVEQLSLSLIPHKTDDGLIVAQRAVDGYINATAMCQAAGKLFADYRRLGTTDEYLKELAADMGIPISELIQSLKGGSGPQGTWVHPDVAIHLAQWLSPKFAVMVSKWVREWLAGGRYGGGAMPYHLQRYMANRGKVPYTHFSILTELTMVLIAPLEERGYTLPDNMVPDISEGKMFAKWMRENIGVDTDTLPTYKHAYEDGRVVDAKLWPVGFLDMFRKHFHEVWLPTKSVEYFEKRDPKAVPHLKALVSVLVSPAYPRGLLPNSPIRGAMPAPPAKKAAKKKGS